MGPKTNTIKFIVRPYLLSHYSISGNFFERLAGAMERANGSVEVLLVGAHA